MHRRCSLHAVINASTAQKPREVVSKDLLSSNPLAFSPTLLPSRRGCRDDAVEPTSNAPDQEEGNTRPVQELVPKMQHDIPEVSAEQ